MQRRDLAALALTAALTLSACGGGQQASEPAPSNPPSATPTMPDLDQFTPAPTGQLDEDTQETASPVAVPTWDEASRTSIIKAAETAMKAFARPSLDQKTWWADVQPLLTQQASADYSYVQPASIPANKVTGAGKLVDDSSAYVGVVEVPSNAGTYTLILNRSAANAPWKVSRFTPPEEAN